MRMYDVAVRKGTFRHVESELELYHDTRKEIIRMNNETSSDGPLHSGGSLLNKQTRLREIERFIRAIDYVFERLPADKQEFIKLNYWTRPPVLNWRGMAKQLHCSTKELSKWQFEIVFAIAHELGWE